MEGIVKKWIFVVTVITFWSGSSDAAQLKDYGEFCSEFLKIRYSFMVVFEIIIMIIRM